MARIPGKLFAPNASHHLVILCNDTRAQRPDFQVEQLLDIIDDMRREPRLQARVGQISSWHYAEVLVLHHLDSCLGRLEAETHIEHAPSVHAFLNILAVL